MINKTSRFDLSFIGKLLIAISFAFIFYGVFLDINYSKRNFDPIKDVKKDTSDFTSVSVDANSSDNNSKKANFDGNSNEEEDLNQANRIDDTNKSLKEAIEKNFDVVIKYGSETDGYEVGGYNTVPINDPTVITTSLNNLNDTLKLYPKGLFKEIKAGGIPLTIYLVNNYSLDGVTGATDSNNSFANISVAVIYPFDETFFHESYHYIERYILKKGLSYNSYAWSKYNPDDFNYGNIINNYSYSVTFSDDSFFVNNYAQYSAEEDRASTFEYMMADSKASCLNKDKPVWKKAKLMSSTIDAALDCVNSDVTEYWERFL